MSSDQAISLGHVQQLHTENPVGRLCSVSPHRTRYCAAEQKRQLVCVTCRRSQCLLPSRESLRFPHQASSNRLISLTVAAYSCTAAMVLPACLPVPRC